MLRILLSGLLGLAVLTLCGATGVAVAEDKKEGAKALEGTLTCTKCALGETKACGHALIVMDGDKKVTYYLVDKGGKEPYHAKCCTADVPGTKVSGKIVEKDGKKMIESPKVELPKN